MAREQTMCVLCHMEEKKERLIQELVRRRIPAYLWEYFLESSEHWGTARDGLWEEIKKFSKSPKSRLLADKLQTDLLISATDSQH